MATIRSVNGLSSSAMALGKGHSGDPGNETADLIS